MRRRGIDIVDLTFGEWSGKESHMEFQRGLRDTVIIVLDSWIIVLYRTLACLLCACGRKGLHVATE